jgi:hypothetical protein
MTSVSQGDFVRTAKVFPREIPEEDSANEPLPKPYGVGDVSAGEVSIGEVVADSAGAVAAGLVVVVVSAGVVAAGLAGASVVSVFCSHAARSAAPARMQMYFFIVIIGNVILV